MPDYSGEAATVIPSISGMSPGETMRYMQNRQDNMKLREDQLRSQKEARRLTLINHVESSADPAKYLIGDATVDAHTTAQLEDVKAKTFKYLKDNPDADPTDIAMQINNSVTPIAVAHAKMKAVSDDINKNLLLAKTDLPSLNDSKLREEARKAAFLKMGADGKPTYKSADEINGNSNYVQDVINNAPERVVDNAMPFAKYLQSLKTNELKARKGDQYAGVRVKTAYDAKLSPFRELDVTDQGDVKGLKYKTETQKMPDGSTVDTVPENEFQLATAEPNARLAFYKLWNENKGKYGVGNVPNDDPTSQIMQRKFMLDYMKHTNIDHSSYSEYKDQTNSGLVNAMQAGVGPKQMASYRAGLSLNNSLKLNEVRDKQFYEHEGTRQADRLKAKQTPGVKAVRATPKKENTHGI